jgi:hypothetical protein
MLAPAEKKTGEHGRKRIAFFGVDPDFKGP